MPAKIAYETDIVAWSREQAQWLKAGRFDQLDLEHLASEPESRPGGCGLVGRRMGRRDRPSGSGNGVVRFSRTLPLVRRTGAGAGLAAGVIGTDKPVCSVSVANYNGLTTLAACLDAVLNQEGGLPVEIIVHDDASSAGGGNSADVGLA